MGLFETVQLELFDFMGFKKPHTKVKPALKSDRNKSQRPQFIDELPYSVEVNRKAGLRGLRFHVSLGGVLQISTNKSARDTEILSLLEPHQKWIQKQIQKNSLIIKHFPQKKWASGESFLFNGQKMTLVLSPSSTKKAHIRFMDHSFEYFYPLTWQKLSEVELNKKLHTNFLYFFKLKASEILNKKVSYWTKQMELFPKSVAYRNQKTRWGSCSSDGSLNLNWRLASFDKDIQDYVIVHELAHLQHQDHSKRFWALVESFLPNRKATSKRLQDTALNADCYSIKSELYPTNPALY